MQNYRLDGCHLALVFFNNSQVQKKTDRNFEIENPPQVDTSAGGLISKFLLEAILKVV